MTFYRVNEFKYTLNLAQGGPTFFDEREELRRRREGAAFKGALRPAIFLTPSWRRLPCDRKHLEGAVRLQSKVSNHCGKLGCIHHDYEENVEEKVVWTLLLD